MNSKVEKYNAKTRHKVEIDMQNHFNICRKLKQFNEFSFNLINAHENWLESNDL